MTTDNPAVKQALAWMAYIRDPEAYESYTGFNDDDRPILAAVQAEARAEALRRVEAAIFDLPIGNDVTYSRGYSAAIAEVRRVIRDTPEET